MPELDVAVVGGGPVGVTTGLLCARRGLRAAVIERGTDVYGLPRAIVLDDESQRMFQGVGLTAALRSITTPLLGAEFVTADRVRVVGFEVDAPVAGPLGHHPVICFDQPELETWLRAEAVAAGASLRLGEEVLGVEPADGGATVCTSAGSIDARWVVAADGAGSPTRRALGIAFEDQGFDQEWLVVDVRLHGADPGLPVVVQQVCDADRPVTYVPGHDRWRRWELQLQPGETAEAMTDTVVVWDLLAPWLGPEHGDLVRAVVYRFHATVAASMRSGPVFLAGDAAHQMPPFLGQGLNSGLRDAANLAWKLAMVSAGGAGERLLDSYDLERRPHAAAVVAHAVDAGRLVDQLAGRVDSGVSTDAGYGGERPFPRLTAGVLAGDHPAVGRPLPQPAVAEGWFDDRLGNGFAVLHRAGAAVPAAWDGVVVEAGLLDDLVPAEGGVVVRPDRIVAAVAETGDELAARTAELDAWRR